MAGGGWRRGVRVAALALVAGGCGAPDLRLPDADEVAAYYQTPGGVSVEMNGNVAEVTVDQPSDQLLRGGELWARVGPYVFLFSEGTRDLFAEYPGLAGVRVITRGPTRVEVARALLLRDALNPVRWRRALDIAGRARVGGTERVTLIEALVHWGEEHTTYHYNPSFVPSRW